MLWEKQISSLKVCLHNNDVLITERFFLLDFEKVLRTDDNLVKTILTRMDPQKQLKTLFDAR